MSLAVERLIGARDSDEALGQFLLTLRTRGFRTQQLLNAVERAPRASFVSPHHVGFAYHDMSLPLPCGQETGRPLAVIEAVVAMGLEPHHRVLEIGSGSGWQTALIAGHVSALASVERWKMLADAADERLQLLGFDNAVIAHGDGAGGLPDAGPFERIIFNGAIEAISPQVTSQLTENGMIIAPILGKQRNLVRFTRLGDGFAQEVLGPSDASPLVDGVAENL